MLFPDYDRNLLLSPALFDVTQGFFRSKEINFEFVLLCLYLGDTLIFSVVCFSHLQLRVFNMVSLRTQHL
jgi:hypothetical protein